VKEGEIGFFSTLLACIDAFFSDGLRFSLEGDASPLLESSRLHTGERERENRACVFLRSSLPARLLQLDIGERILLVGSRLTHTQKDFRPLEVEGEGKHEKRGRTTFVALRTLQHFIRRRGSLSLSLSRLLREKEGVARPQHQLNANTPPSHYSSPVHKTDSASIIHMSLYSRMILVERQSRQSNAVRADCLLLSPSKCD